MRTQLFLALIFLVACGSEGGNPGSAAQLDANDANTSAAIIVKDMNVIIAPQDPDVSDAPARITYSAIFDGVRLTLDTNDLNATEFWQDTMYIAGNTACRVLGMMDVDSTPNIMRVIYRQYQDTPDECLSFVDRPFVLSISDKTIRDYVDPSSDPNIYLNSAVHTQIFQDAAGKHPLISPDVSDACFAIEAANGTWSNNRKQNYIDISMRDLNDQNTNMTFVALCDPLNQHTGNNRMSVIDIDSYAWKVMTNDGGHREALIYKMIAKCALDKTPATSTDLNIANPFPLTYFHGGEYSQYWQDRPALIQSLITH